MIDRLPRLQWLTVAEYRGSSEPWALAKEKGTMATRSYFLTAGPQADPLPNLLVERGPQDKGVGAWVPEDKHRMLAEYLYATRNAWRSPVWRHRVYIDPFCGPGRIQVRDEQITRDGGAVVAWRESQQAGVPFTLMLVGDLNPERASAASARLKALGAPVRAFVGPASETILQMVAAVPRRDCLCLAYLDPYNLELLTFELFQALAGLRVDIAAHFSTMDLLRNAAMEFDPARDRFEGTAPGWRTDPEICRLSLASVPAKFFEYWERLVRGLGFTSSQAMPLIRNDEGRGIYRLVFFAKHGLPLRVWADVAKDAQQSLLQDL